MEDRNIYDEAYDEGYKDGKDDDGVQNFAQSLTKGYRMPFSDEKINESYNLGYEDGVSDYYDEKNSNYRGKNRDIKNYKGYKQREKEEAEYQKRIQRQKEAEEAEYQQQSSYQTSSNEGDNSCLVLIGFLIIVAAVLWFVFAVAIPLVLINIATISLIAGLARKDWSKYLFPLSILGGIGIVFDYNYGWATEALVTNVPFFQEFIPAFFYFNIVTGLIAAYFLTRNLLNDKYGISEREFSKRNLIIMGCLVITGGLTIGLQKYFDLQSPNPIRSNTVSVLEDGLDGTQPNSSSTISKPSNNNQPNMNQAEQHIDSGAFYIINVAAYNKESQAKAKASELKKNGISSGHLWIPDYASLSGAQLYSVYIGPFFTQYDCEVATEEYRKKHPGAYGVLVSQDRKRVQIYGIGKVTVTPKESTPITINDTQQEGESGRNILPTQTGTVTFGERTYKTIILNGKTWMAQNLDINVRGSWCYGDKDENCYKYGRLYTWQAAQEACKQLGLGWRLPSYEEWIALGDQFGDGEGGYKALIDGGKTDFAALLGGIRGPDGASYYLNLAGHYWSGSAIGGTNTAYNFSFTKQNERAFSNSTYKSNALSCRCLKEM